MTLDASDQSQIKADAGGLGIALNASPSSSGDDQLFTGSVGVSAAVNTITDTTRAYIAGSAVTAGGALTLDANSTSVIDALTIGGAFAGTFGGDQAFTFDGAGAGSGNTVSNIVEAFVDQDFLFTTASTSSIVNDLDAGQVDAALSKVFSDQGYALSSDASVTKNAAGEYLLTDRTNGNTYLVVPDHGLLRVFDATGQGSTVSAGSVQITAEDRRLLFQTTSDYSSDLNQGNVPGGLDTEFQHNGITLSSSTFLKVDTLNAVQGWLIHDRLAGRTYLVLEDATGGMSIYDTSQITSDAGGLSIALKVGESQGLSLSVGIGAAVNHITNTIQAFVADSTVAGTGGVDIAATSTATIDAFTLGGALNANIGEGTGFDGSGAGAGSGNTIQDVTAAYIQHRDPSDSNITSVTASAGALSVDALDLATKLVDAGGFAIALKLGEQNGLGLSVGLSVAINTIDDTVQADIDHAAALGQSVAVQATSEAPIEALTAAGALTAHVNTGEGFGLDGSGAGAGGRNQVTDTVTAYVTGSTTPTGSGVQSLHGDVNVEALDDSTIDVQSYAVALGAVVSAGGSGLAIAAGGSVAKNSISNTIDAYIDSSTVDSQGGLTVSSQETSMISALTVGAVAALSVATSEGTIAGGGSGVGAVTANAVANKVQAYIDDANVHSGSDLVVQTTSTNSMDAYTVGVAGSAAINVSEKPISLAGAGVGTRATNTIADSSDYATTAETVADITGGTVVADQGISVTATDNSIITKAENTNVAASLGLIGVSVGISTATNTVANTVQADIDDAQVTSNNAGVDVSAQSNSDIQETHSLAAAASLSIGGAGTGATDTASVHGATEAYLGPRAVVIANNGTVTVKSTSDSTAMVNTSCGSGALIAGDTSDATALIDRNTLGHVDQGAQVTAQGLTVEAHSTTMDAEATSLLGTVGLAAGGMSETVTATVSGDVDAYIGAQQGTASNGRQTRIDISGPVAITAQSDQATARADSEGGDVTVKATSDATADGELHGGSGAVGLTVTILEADSTQGLYTDAYIGDDVNLLARGVDVEARVTTQNATTNVVVGAGSIVASGSRATGNATIAGGTLAHIGTDFDVSKANLLLVSWGDGSDVPTSANNFVVVGLDNKNLLHIRIFNGDGQEVADTDETQLSAPEARKIASLKQQIPGFLQLFVSHQLSAAQEAQVLGDVASILGDSLNSNPTMVTVTGGSVQVIASSDPLATNNVLIASGAIVASGREADATTTVQPMVQGYIGHGTTVTTSQPAQQAPQSDQPAPGGIVVSAVSSAEGHAEAQSYGGAIIGDGGAANATTTVQPTVQGYIGDGSTITAAGSVKVTADFIQAGSAPNDQITEVNPNTGTITVGNLPLQAGDVVTYSGGSNPITTPSGNLPDYSTRREYNVLVKGANEFQLGSTFTGAGVDPLTDTITFPTPDNFATGDAVRVSFNDFPQATFDPATSVDRTADTITLTSNPGLITGDPVVYHNGGGRSISPLQDGAAYYVILSPSNSDVIELAYTAADAAAGQAIQLNPSTATGTQHSFTADHGGLTSGTQYYVHVINTTTTKLATSLAQAELTPDRLPAFRSSAVANSTITLAHNGFTENQAVTYYAPDTAVQFSSGMVDVKLDSTNRHLAPAPSTSLTTVTFMHNASGGDTITRRSGSWARDGFLLGQVFQVSGSTSNNGGFTVAGVTDGGRTLILSSDSILTDETDTGLATPVHFAGAGGVPDPAANNIVIQTTDSHGNITGGHGFSDGEALVYTVPSEDSPIGGLTSGDRYYALVLSPYDLQLTPSYASVSGLKFNAASGKTLASIVRLDGQHWSNFGFSAGQTFTITGTPQRENDGTFTIDHVSGATLYLIAGEKVKAETINPRTNAPVVVRGSVIALDPAKETAQDRNVSQSLIPATDLPIGGLHDGQTYYVNVINANQFQLMDTPNGSIQPLDAAGLKGTNHIGTDGVDLGPMTSLASDNLYLVLSTAGSGTQRLLGPGGTPLADILSSGGDGISSATALGGSGSIVLEVGVPHGNLTLAPTVDAYIGSAPDSNGMPTAPAGTATSVVAAGDVTIATTSTAAANDYVDVQSGAIINVGTAKGKLTITNTSRANVGNQVQIQAGGNFSLTASSSSTPTITVNALGGGGISNADAEAAELVDFETHANIGSGAKVQAGGQLASDTNAQVNALDQAQAFSGATIIYAGAFANHSNSSDYLPEGIEITGNSMVDIGAGADLSADTVDLSALISSLHATAQAGAESFLVIVFLGGTADYAGANITTDTNAEVYVHGAAATPTSITGTQGVDIRALTEDVNLERDASRLGVGLIPIQEASAGSSVDPALGTSPAINLSTLVAADKGVTIVAGSRSSDTVLQQPASSPPNLALFVDSQVDPVTALVNTWHVYTQTGYWGVPGAGNNNSLNPTAIYDIGTFTSGYYVDTTPNLPNGNIHWDANVTVLGGSSAAPFLEVDDKGSVVQASGVAINGGAAPPKPGDSVDPNHTGAYSVNEITNSGPGAVLMKTNLLIQNVASSDVVGWPLFTFSQSLSGVTIIDHSSLKLELKNINVLAPIHSQPIVRLETDLLLAPLNMEFNIQDNYTSSTVVDIEKLPPTGPGDPEANVVLQGSINNPLGQTKIVDTFGSIIAALKESSVTTNALYVSASDSIGAKNWPLPVDLIQYLDPSSGTTQTTDLNAFATNDIFLDLTGHDRVPGSDASQPNPFVVNVGDVQSQAGSMNLTLEDSVSETGEPMAGYVDVQLYEEYVAEVYNKDYWAHFVPDPSGTPATLDVAAYATDPVLIDSTYTFANLTAGGNIELNANPVYHSLNGGRATPVIAITGFTDINPLPSDSGHIDASTVGNITLTEIAGAMRVGNISAVNGNIALTVEDADPPRRRSPGGNHIPHRCLAGGPDHH